MFISLKVVGIVLLFVFASFWAKAGALSGALKMGEAIARKEVGVEEATKFNKEQSRVMVFPTIVSLVSFVGLIAIILYS